MTKKTIEQMLDEYIQESRMGRYETKNGRKGIVFLDENQWIPIDDLGYSRELGFYQLSLFPHVQNEAG